MKRETCFCCANLVLYVVNSINNIASFSFNHSWPGTIFRELDNVMSYQYFKIDRNHPSGAMLPWIAN